MGIAPLEAVLMRLVPGTRRAGQHASWLCHEFACPRHFFPSDGDAHSARAAIQTRVRAAHWTEHRPRHAQPFLCDVECMDASAAELFDNADRTRQSLGSTPGHTNRPG